MQVGTQELLGELAVPAGENINIALGAGSSFSVDTDTLYVDEATGRVGIGTTTPTASLQINALDNSTQAALAIRQSGNTGNGFDLSLDQAVDGKLYLSSLLSGSPTTRIAIDPTSGNVGIGTAAPDYKLTVKGAGTTTGVGIITLNSADGAVFYTRDDGNVWSAQWSGSAVNATIDANGFVIRDPSDRKFKENEKPITGALIIVKKLQGKSFDWKVDSMMTSDNAKEDDDRSCFGFIAQDVEQVVKSLVSTGEYKSVKTLEIIAIHNEAIKEQQTIIESQQSQIDALTARLDKAGL